MEEAIQPQDKPKTSLFSNILPSILMFLVPAIIMAAVIGGIVYFRNRLDPNGGVSFHAPTSVKVAQGSSFYVPITLDTGEKTLTEFNLDVDYDTSKLTLQDIIYNPGNTAFTHVVSVRTDEDDNEVDEKISDKRLFLANAQSKGLLAFKGLVAEENSEQGFKGTGKISSLIFKATEKGIAEITIGDTSTYVLIEESGSTIIYGAEAPSTTEIVGIDVKSVDSGDTFIMSLQDIDRQKVKYVSFSLNGALQFVTFSPPFEVSWTVPEEPEDTYILELEATYHDGSSLSGEKVVKT